MGLHLAPQVQTVQSAIYKRLVTAVPPHLDPSMQRMR